MAAKGEKDPIYGDMIGMKYGRLTILENGRAMDNIKCQCECGTICYPRRVSVTSGVSSSCGCYRMEKAIAACTTHGLGKHYLFSTWHGIKSRCLNPLSQSYEYYGAIGICVHPTWLDLEVFIHDVHSEIGVRPEGLSLDRIDPYGNYEPGNIRWATAHIQNTNKRERPLPSSGFRWVSKPGRCFRGSFRHKGEKFSYYFPTAEEAYKAVIEKRISMGLPVPK